MERKIGKKIENYLHENGIMKSWFANKIGMSLHMLSHIITGRKGVPKPHWGPIIHYSRGFIGLDDLLGDYLIDCPNISIRRGSRAELCWVELKNYENKI